MLIKGLYTIQHFRFEDQSVKATLQLNKDHRVFEGHFPGNPVMPGVCMIQIIKELTEKALEKKLFLSVASNVKFMAIINPEKNGIIQLVLDITEEDAIVKVKNTTSFEDTVALKLNATFKTLS
ncbi:3-hydroxyacyl-ACP dehydratase [Maribacter algicola]|uniref:3-hydroxyacyl-ACP dehydratase n=1 Tax=Meishania litoralis TaxID=3434685 RepID=A0ACC7LIA8_9FLAO